MPTDLAPLDVLDLALLPSPRLPPSPSKSNRGLLKIDLPPESPSLKTRLDVLIPSIYMPSYISNDIVHWSQPIDQPPSYYAHYAQGCERSRVSERQPFEREDSGRSFTIEDRPEHPVRVNIGEEDPLWNEPMRKIFNVYGISPCMHAIPVPEYRLYSGFITCLLWTPVSIPGVWVHQLTEFHGESFQTMIFHFTFDLKGTIDKKQSTSLSVRSLTLIFL